VPEPVDLDARIGELFAAPSDGFVAAREALVRDLKREDRRDKAAEVHALRRPTIAVWAINQLARARPDQIAALVAVGAELQARQREGPEARDELRAASRNRRALLDELTEMAAAFADRPESVRAGIAATLDAASLDEAVQGDLVRGRLTAELSPPVRFFGDLGDGDGTPAPRRAVRPSARKAASSPPRDDLAARRAETALAEARARAAERDDEARAAEEAARGAQDELETAHRRVADLEAALAAARADVTELKRRATEVQRAETRARTAQERATAAVRAAERHVEDARGS
jgi:hypothetical protein